MNYRLKELRQKPETARAGLHWSEEENDQLMTELSEGVDWVDISKKHQRTLTAIRARIMDNGLKMSSEEGLTLQEVADKLHITVEQLEAHKKMKEERNAKVPEKRTELSEHQEMMKVLYEILDCLRTLTTKSSS